MAFFTTIDEFRKYITLDKNTKMDSFRPYIDEAEMLYLVDLLGQEFYDELMPLYIGSVPPTDPIVALSADNTKLLPYIQRCLAYYSSLHAIPHLTVTFGDMGLRQHRSDNSDNVAKWKEEKLQLHALKNADVFADKLLEFLEKNAASDKYGTWFSSGANTKNSGYIIYNTTIASKHIDINNSRRVFMKLRNKIREIEAKHVPKLIGQAQYDELLVQLKTGGSGNPTAANKLLIEKIEPIICKRALFTQLPYMRVQVNENGIFVYSGTDEIFKPGQLASEDDIQMLRCQLKGGDGELGLGYLDDEDTLRQFIKDNINNYPLIRESAAFTVQPDPGPTWIPLNEDPDNTGFYAV